VIAALLIAAPVATALLVAASLRLESFVAALLAAYLVLVAEVVALTGGLSLVRGVTRVGLGVGSASLLVTAAIVWNRVGRPRLPVGHLRAAIRAALSDRLVLAYAIVAGAALAYELLLVFTAQANNWDSLTYHLARVALWAQHGGLYWVPNAPTDRINADQPIAEQQILYLFVAVGRGSLFALPQYEAQLAVIAAGYLGARRLGFELRPAACAGLLFSTFSLVALEATTAQNDLVAAAFPAVGAALLLGTGSTELVLAGLAVALGLGVKVTTALALPALVLLALHRGRRQAAVFAGSAFAAFAALALWSFAVNLSRTGHLLGNEDSQLAHASTSIEGALAMAVAVLYRLGDLPRFRDELAWVLLAIGVNLALVVAAVSRFRRRPLAIGAAAAVGLAFAAPALTLGFAGVVHSLVRLTGLPVDKGAAFLGPNYLAEPTGTFTWAVNRMSQEDLAGFGPIGGVLLIGLSVGAIVAAARRRADARFLALGLALPLFVVLLGTSSASYNAFLARFVIVPAALTLPLAAVLLRNVAAALAILAVSSLSVALVLVHDAQKPFDSPYGHPWQLAQGDAARLTYEPSAGDAVFDLDALVPSYTPIAAVLGNDEPSYLLFGASHRRPVSFLPRSPAAALAAARARHDSFVVIGGVAGVARAFAAHGFEVRDLVDPYWRIAIDCTVPGVRRQPFYHCSP
jgi:hypothetical protein